MKQYTTPEQTAKLIELGFEKPKGLAAYSIGELIELLPKHIYLDSMCLDLYIYANQHLWIVKYSGLFCKKFYRFCSRELADALHDMIIKLKEEGVI
jgi:hypothetical protein